MPTKPKIKPTLSVVALHQHQNKLCNVMAWAFGNTVLHVLHTTYN